MGKYWPYQFKIKLPSKKLNTTLRVRFLQMTYMRQPLSCLVKGDAAICFNLPSHAACLKDLKTWVKAVLQTYYMALCKTFFAVIQLYYGADVKTVASN